MPSIAVTCSAVFPSPPLAIPPPLPITSPPSPISLPSTPLRRSKPLSPPDLLDVLLQSSSPTPHFITNASQTQLLALLPVILYSIHSSSSLLLPPLKARLLSSRRLKLRFLLLCRHPAFKHISPRLHFSSAAYAETIYTPLPRSHTPSQKSTLASSLLRLPVDMVDLQSEDFFRHIIFSQAGPNSSSFGLHLVSHPFIVDNQIPASLQGRHHDLSQSDLSLSSSEDSTNDQEQDLAQTSYIRRIRPAPIIELRRLRPESGASEVSLAHVEPLLPALTLIQGENALQIQTTQLLFYLLNHVWLQPSSRFPDSDAAPICVTFDVVATSAQSGFVQSFPRTQPFRTFNMEFWRDTKGYDPVAVDQFIRTAAGAYTAAYICGVHARNAPDICVRDGDAVFLAAFDGLFVSAPAWRVQVRKDLRATLRALSVWDTFRTCCLRAFAVARETFHDVFPVVAPLYEMCADTSKEAVLKFWAGKTCLNMVDQDAETCDAMFRRWLGN